MIAAIAERRLQNQCITRTAHRRPADVVAWLGAMQAQEFEAAKWGIGLRMTDGVVDADVERAFEQGAILRTHLMRPTWHFVSASDIRWLLELTGPRVQRIVASYNRREELDARTLIRGTVIIERALRDRRYLTRAEMGDELRRAKLVVKGMRLALLTIHAELEGVICSGPRHGKQFTYALVEERAPRARRMKRDEALAELCRRYFTSHGPATIRDFVWWSGLTASDAKRGLEINRARREDVDGTVYWTVSVEHSGRERERPAQLLPIYDEYLVAYRDREAVPHGPSVVRSASRGSVTFQHALVVAGEVVGTWRRDQNPRAVSIRAALLRPLTARERRALAHAVDRYQTFLGCPLELSVS
jgi:Winged helix DNA-binding domain